MTDPDQDAKFETLYRELMPYAQRMARSLGAPPLDADELVMDAFIVLLQRRDELLELDETALKRYAIAVMRRAMMSAYRKQRRHEQRATGGSTDQAIEEISVSDTRDVVTALGELPEGERTLVQLVMRGHSMVEIAKMMELSSGTVYLRYARAIDKLRKRFESVPAPTEVDSDSYPIAEKAMSILVDEDLDANLFAEFLAELARFYTELSGGDELVIREGMVPSRPLVTA